MSRYFRGDTGHVWENFDALRQQALTSLGGMERLLTRLITNGMAVTPAMLEDLRSSVTGQKVWWSNLREQQPGNRRFNIVSKPGEPT